MLQSVREVLRRSCPHQGFVEWQPLEFIRSYGADVEVTRPQCAEIAVPRSLCAFSRKSEIKYERAEADGAPINHAN